MEDTNGDPLIANLKKTGPTKPSEKAARYGGQLFHCQRLETQISGKVQGNQGIYTITVRAKEAKISSACSCYLGKHGFCYHCEALARTFIQEPGQLSSDCDKPSVDLRPHLQTNPLDSLIAQLKVKELHIKHLPKVSA